MASMSIVVPLVSVLVTGLAAPAIAAAATWSISSRQAAVARRTDQIAVMDAAVQAAAAGRTHLGHLYALWRQDVPYDSEETSTTFEKSQLAMEAVRYAHSRIGTRFGPSSPAATTYGELVSGFRAVAHGRKHYRHGLEYVDVAAELEPQMLVKGHADLNAGGRETCMVADNRIERWWPRDLPGGGGHRPLVSGEGFHPLAGEGLG
jgi:hypothetical protein